MAKLFVAAVFGGESVAERAGDGRLASIAVNVAVRSVEADEDVVEQCLRLVSACDFVCKSNENI